MKIDRDKVRRAQSNMMVVIGIAIGIDLMKSGEVDGDKSFFENAIENFSQFDDEFLKSMARDLQLKINELEE